MAIQWGGTAGHMQVGIDVRTSAYDWTTGAVDVYVDYYVRTIGWGANDDQTLAAYVNGGHWTTFSYHINSPTGGSVQMHVGTLTIGGQGIGYGGGPNYHFQGNVGGSNLGGNPSHAINWSLPARPPGPPTLPGVWISNVSAFQALLNVSGSADHRGSTVHTYNQQIVRGDGAVVAEWNGGTGWFATVPNTNYYGRSQAINGVGSSGWATTAWFTTPNTTQNAPTALTAGLAAVTSVPLSWTPAPSTGGTATTGYTIQASADGTFGAGTLTMSVGAVTSATFGGLTPGLTYRFRVRAENAAGSSPSWSATASATTLATNTVRVPGVGYVPVRAWGRIPGLGWRPLTVWKRPAGNGGAYKT